MKARTAQGCMTVARVLSVVQGQLEHGYVVLTSLCARGVCCSTGVLPRASAATARGLGLSRYTSPSCDKRHPEAEWHRKDQRSMCLQSGFSLSFGRYVPVRVKWLSEPVCVHRLVSGEVLIATCVQGPEWSDVNSPFAHLFEQCS